MKIQALLILFCLTIFFALGCSGAKYNNALIAEEGTEIRIYEVFGMDCPGCHGGLEKLVNRVPGVVTSVANWKEKRLAVKIQDGANVKDESVFEAIKLANFTPGKRLQ